EEPDHFILRTEIGRQIEKLEAQEKAEREQAENENREHYTTLGKKYAKENGLDPNTLPEDILLEFGMWMEKGLGEAEAEEDEPVSLIRKDDDVMALVTPTGQIISFIDAPIWGSEDERENVLKWVGE